MVVSVSTVEVLVSSIVVSDVSIVSGFIVVGCPLTTTAIAVASRMANMVPE